VTALVEGKDADVLREGPLPAFVHGVLEYLAGAISIAAPFLFGFRDGRATGAAVVAGLLILSLTASSALPTGLVRTIPVVVHATADVVLALVLIAVPFALGFRAEASPTAFFIVLGVVHLLVTIATRFPAGERAGRRSPR
jgi:hypothetical protein